MTEHRYSIPDAEQRPKKNYRTCTLEGLGPRKDEFLNRIVAALEERGLKKMLPIEPFELSFSVKDALRVWDWSVFLEMSRHQMVGADVLLGSDEKGVHIRKGFRAEARGKNLRFGYFQVRWLEPRSAEGIKFLIKLFSWIILSLIGGISIVLLLPWNLFIESYGEILSFLVLLTILLPPQILIVYLIYRSKIRPWREMDQLISSITESMGGKQITPFKQTTVKLED